MSESLRIYPKRILKTAIPVALMLFFLISCKEKSIPKPYGYFRIDFPEKSYRKIPQGLPYSFEIPGYSIVEPDMDRNAEPFWINIQVPSNRAQIHISYKKVEGNLFLFAEQSRKLAYDHAIKASSIREEIFRDENHRVFGTIYHIDGNSASPIQFYLTDSSRHFIRGSLYIKATPRIDSLKPVIDFLKTDVSRLIETLEWTE